MDSRAKELREQIRVLKVDLAAVENKLRVLELECRHTWAEPEYAPDIRAGYRVEAVEMGSDSAPAYYVPEQVTPRWRRTCTKCGMVEETTRATERVTKTPEW